MTKKLIKTRVAADLEKTNMPVIKSDTFFEIRSGVQNRCYSFIATNFYNKTRN
jgi:hypothetical protein